MDERSLQLIEYFHVTAALADRAASDAGRSRLSKWRPMADSDARAIECARLQEAIRRSGEPGTWWEVGGGDLSEILERLERDGPEGEALAQVGSWIEAGARVAAAWREPGLAERFPSLAPLAPVTDPLEGLRQKLSAALDEDGEVKDGASPALRRLRSEVSTGEKRLADHLERWSRAFGADAYVTRHGERFVAMVPAAGFPRRRAIVHDVSGSGQSLLVEPLEWCGENNRMIEARRAAQEEARRILAELAGEVAAARPELEALEQRLIHLDTLQARAAWAREFGAIALTPGGDELRLKEARHPLLAMGVGRERRGDLIPLDLELHGPRVPGRVLLVSGPNMGGKTVLLKTAGLATALAHAALPVTAAEGTRIPEFDQVVVDIGDEQSLEQGLSTFAAHLRALSRMVEAAGPRTLVLADELGAGTDPDDGAALARAVVERVAAAGAWAVMTTHLGSLKRLAGEVPGVENGSLEFDVETLTARFRFLAGVPGASHALEVAERLGVAAALIERARQLRPEGAAAADRLMADLAQATQRARDEATALASARSEAESEAARLRVATEESRREEAALRRRLTRESEAILARAREVWQVVQRDLRREEKLKASPEAVRREMAEIDAAVEALAGTPSHIDGPGVDPGALAPGVKVRVVDLGVEAEVVAPPDREGRVQLKRGAWSIQSHVRKLAPATQVETAARPRAERPVAATWSGPEGLPLEVDLRGMDVSDALVALDRGVDQAVLAGLGEVRVIHGVGRGVLRVAVEKHLRGHAQVSGQRVGAVGEGGRGVTVARLR